RAREQWASNLWINPIPEKYWGYTHSIQMIRELFDDRMVPMTLAGLETGMKDLTR
ncbi:MAG: VWA domain-containing protein, partial [Pseudomonadota bacterium]